MNAQPHQKLPHEVAFTDLCAADVVKQCDFGRHDLAGIDQSLIDRGLSFWRDNSPSKWKLYIREDGITLIPHSFGCQYCLPAKMVIGVGAQCDEMKECPGFDSVVKSLFNSTAFVATLFMISSAHICYRMPATQNFVFSPLVKARAGMKRPDFAFDSPHGRIVCECKDMQSIDRIRNDYMLRMLRDLEDAIRKVALPPDLRPEVFYRSRPTFDPKRLASHIATGFHELGKRRFLKPVKMNYKKVGSITICLTERTKPLFFKAAKGAMSLLETGESPVVDVATAPVVLFSDKCDATAIGAHIREANQQLPEKGWTMIFINPTHGVSPSLAVEQRIKLPEYSNVLAIVFAKGTKWNLQCRTRNLPVLRQVLSGIFDG